MFLVERNLPSADLFNDSKLPKLPMLTDITEHLNNLNLKRQGKDILVTDMAAAISAFEVKLRLWEAQLIKKADTL